MLLAIVFGVVLVLIGVTASALAAVISANLSGGRLSTVVEYDAQLVELFVNDNVRVDDLDADGPTPTREALLSARLASLTESEGILRVEIRDRTGQIVASSDETSVGRRAASSKDADAALAGTPVASLLSESTAAAGGNSLPATDLVQEYLPILSSEKEPIAVVALWRDARPILARDDATRRDVMLVTLVAGVLLAGMLLLLFRSSQARLTRQHRQLIDATRRDALTGLLNHGAVVTLLADRLEVARAAGIRIGVALIDVDNFRLFNDIHGHGAGDEVLTRVAEVVSREWSVGSVARYGPDEFLLVQEGSGTAEIETAVARVRAALDEISVQFGPSDRLPVTVSVGISAFPEFAASVTDLVSSAAVALGEAKASGGNGVCIAEAGDDDRSVAGSFDVLQGLVIAVDTKDRYTKRHSEDVARYAVFLATRLGLDDEMVRTIHLAGLLHDIGKIGIPNTILRKPSKLTADEYGVFQQHVTLGDAIVRDVPNVDLVRAGIRHHHERWDGNGYLEGLEAEGIPLIARILAVADAFSAMTTTRPYRKALPMTEALARLGDAAGTQLEEELVASFITGIETAPDAPIPGEEPSQLWRPELWVA